MLGAIIPAPFAIAPTRAATPPTANGTVTSLGRVSVVMMARAAKAPPSQDSAATARGIPSRSLSMGRWTPMTPVEATTTSSGRHPKAVAVSDAISRASRSPRSPVAALAHPAFTTTARAWPPRRCSRETTTGAAWARFVVKTPAAAQVRSATSRARSGWSGLMPAATAAARKPRGAVTLTESDLPAWSTR